MNTHPLLLSVALGYLLGSIPFGYLLVRRFRGQDVRSTGSGNIGATNVARTSPVLGVITLLLDAGKGLAAVALVLHLLPGMRTLAFAAAASAIAGHVFPVWLGFRGGKGVATGLGSFFLLTPKTVLIGIAVFAAMVAAFRWVALASIASAALLPVISWWTGESQLLATPAASPLTAVAPVLLISASSLLIIFKHHSNIRRLLAGTEPRFGMKRT